MFGGLEAALVFLLLVMPGVLLIGGYYGGLGRTQAVSTSAVHTLAQAIAWSVLLLSPALYLTNVTEWIEKGELEKHFSELVPVAYVTIFLPYAFGFVIGLVAKNRPWVARIMGSGTGWGSVAYGRGESTQVRVHFADSDSAPPIVGDLDLGDSKLEPGARLTVREADASGSTHDVVVASDQVHRVEFLEPPSQRGQRAPIRFERRE